MQSLLYRHIQRDADEALYISCCHLSETVREHFWENSLDKITAQSLMKLWTLAQCTYVCWNLRPNIFQSFTTSMVSTHEFFPSLLLKGEKVDVPFERQLPPLNMPVFVNIRRTCHRLSTFSQQKTGKSLPQTPNSCFRTFPTVRMRIWMFEHCPDGPIK